MNYRIETKDRNGMLMYVDISHLFNVNMYVHYPNDFISPAQMLCDFNDDYIVIEDITCLERFQRNGYASILFEAFFKYIEYYYNGKKVKYIRGWLSPHDMPYWNKSISFYSCQFDKRNNFFKELIIYEEVAPEKIYSKEYILNHKGDFSKGLIFKYIFPAKAIQCTVYIEQLFLRSIR